MLPGELSLHPEGFLASGDENIGWCGHRQGQGVGCRKDPLGLPVQTRCCLSPGRGSPQASFVPHDPLREERKNMSVGPTMESLQLMINPLSEPQGPLRVVLQLKKSIIQPTAGRKTINANMVNAFHLSPADIASEIKISGQGKAGSEGYHGDLNSDIGTRYLADSTVECMHACMKSYSLNEPFI